MSKRIISHCDPQPNGCDYYRSILPARKCGPALKESGIDLEIVYSCNEDDEYAASIIHRLAPDTAIRHLIYRQSQGVPFAFDCDDLLTELPPWNPVKRVWRTEDSERFKSLAGYAKSRFTSTQFLADRIGGGEVLPNLADLNDWNGGIDHPQERSRIRIVWTGSDTHHDDLLVVIKPLQNLIARHGDRIQVIFFGYMPPPLLTSNTNQIQFIPMGPVGRYPSVLSSIRPHISLMPLVDHPFNRAKSNCKFIESTLAGAACVMARETGTYADCAGYSVLRNESEWEEAIDELINFHEQRANLHSRALEQVRREFSWQHSPAKQKWLQAISSLVS